jgi:hypothetical protein
MNNFIFDNVLDFINKSFRDSDKIILIGIYYPIKVNNKNTIDSTNIKLLKKYIINKNNFLEDKYTNYIKIIKNISKLL